ncbi:hypothetical protein C7S15_1030 [Burkholderia cepacia]|nr:hypothetical protein [Burkholderia cepacia]
MQHPPKNKCARRAAKPARRGVDPAIRKERQTACQPARQPRRARVLRARRAAPGNPA